VILSVADAANAPPALVVNENVAALEALAATRSVDAMANVGLVTLSPIWPDAMLVGLALASAVVWMEIELAPANTTPMVSPDSVMVTAVLSAIDDEPVSVSTMLVSVGAALVAVTVPPLIAAVGLGDVAKKPVG
jgi:hypothetical protein